MSNSQQLQHLDYFAPLHVWSLWPWHSILLVASSFDQNVGLINDKTEKETERESGWCLLLISNHSCTWANPGVAKRTRESQSHLGKFNQNGLKRSLVTMVYFSYKSARANKGSQVRLFYERASVTVWTQLSSIHPEHINWNSPFNITGINNISRKSNKSFKNGRNYDLGRFLITLITRWLFYHGVKLTIVPAWGLANRTTQEHNVPLSNRL